MARHSSRGLAEYNSSQLKDNAMKLQRAVKAVVRPCEEPGYVAECVEIPVVTQWKNLDEEA
jgi:hypothetical protein